MEDSEHSERPSAGKLSVEERLKRLNKLVSARTMEGALVVSTNDSDASAVLRWPAEDFNHTPHVIATVFLCGLWAPVWGIMYANRSKEKRSRISIDEYGNLIDEELTIKR